MKITLGVFLIAFAVAGFSVFMVKDIGWKGCFSVWGFVVGCMSFAFAVAWCFS